MIAKYVLACAAMVVVLLGVAPLGVRANPADVTFGGREYEVHYTRGHVWLTEDREYVGDLGAASVGAVSTHRFYVLLRHHGGAS